MVDVGGVDEKGPL